MKADKLSETSDGNHVYVGNFDQHGLNVNNNWDDNPNDNLAVVLSRNFSLYLN